MGKRLLREKMTIEGMVKIYCNGKHRLQNSICDDCKELLDYAESRLQRCIYGARKPVCARCTVHCYKQEMRDRVRSVMRYSGKRMLVRHPVTTMQHFLDLLIYNNKSGA